MGMRTQNILWVNQVHVTIGKVVIADEIVLWSVYSNGTTWYDGVSHLLSYADDPSVTYVVGDIVGTFNSIVFIQSV